VSPENGAFHHFTGAVLVASTRPGFVSPENSRRQAEPDDDCVRFNEAGLREPGERPAARELVEGHAVASTRPGFVSPENVKGGWDNGARLTLLQRGRAS